MVLTTRLLIEYQLHPVFDDDVAADRGRATNTMSSAAASAVAAPATAVRAVIVTGASRGIGASVVKYLLARGVNVLAVARQEPASPALWQPSQTDKDAVGNAGGIGRAVFIKGDLADKTLVAKLINSAIKEFGRIDAIVNNAACVLLGFQSGCLPVTADFVSLRVLMLACSLLEPIADLQDVDLDVSRHSFEVNVIACIALMQAALKHMHQRGAAEKAEIHGRIVNVSSIGAVNPAPSTAIYSA